MQQDEIWRDIKGYEGLYQVSNLGRIKSLKFKSEKILSPGIISGGYYAINLYKNNIRKQYRIHRLVAEAFIPNPENYPIINHKSEIKTENFVENLEWCSYKYNSNYGTAIKRRAEKKNKKVYCYNADVYIEFDSCADAGIKVNRSASAIHKAAKKGNKCAGLNWSYLQ